MLAELDGKGWELYNFEEDFAETNNLAEKERDRLIAMIGMWYTEAGKYNVLPIDSRGTARFADERPQIAVDRKQCIFYAGTQVVPGSAAPRLINVAHSISVHATVPKAGVEGAGEHIFSFEFTPTGKPDIAKGKGVPAKIALFIDGKPVGTGDIPVTIPLSLGLAAGLCLGSDGGSPVMTDYKPPFAFTGVVKKAMVDVTGEALEDKAEKMKMYLARQ